MKVCAFFCIDSGIEVYRQLYVYVVSLPVHMPLPFSVCWPRQGWSVGLSYGELAVNLYYAGSSVGVFPRKQ